MILGRKKDKERLHHKLYEQFMLVKSGYLQESIEMIAEYYGCEISLVAEMGGKNHLIYSTYRNNDILGYIESEMRKIRIESSRVVSADYVKRVENTKFVPLYAGKVVAVLIVEGGSSQNVVSEENNNILGMVALITRHYLLEKENELISLTDKVTGLRNREGLCNALEAYKEKGELCDICLCMVRIKNLSLMINASSVEYGESQVVKLSNFLLRRHKKHIYRVDNSTFSFLVWGDELQTQEYLNELIDELQYISNQDVEYVMAASKVSEDILYSMYLCESYLADISDGVVFVTDIITGKDKKGFESQEDAVSHFYHESEVYTTVNKKKKEDVSAEPDEVEDAVYRDVDDGPKEEDIEYEYVFHPEGED